MPEFRYPENFSELPPEEQEEWRQRGEQESKKRVTKEQLEDEMYKQRQEGKLLKELGEGKKERPTRRTLTKKEIDWERNQAEKFLTKQKDETKKKEKKEKEIDRLMSDPSLVQQEPPGGYKCMNQVAGEPCDKPASTKLIHGGLLGDTPPITLCKDCSKLLKIINIGEEDDEESERRVRRRKIEKEMADWEKEQRKEEKRKKKTPDEEPLGAPSMSMRRSNISHITLQKIAKLANKLDSKGLHNEADLLDKILK
jgi:hypothetical protein